MTTPAPSGGMSWASLSPEKIHDQSLLLPCRRAGGVSGDCPGRRAGVRAVLVRLCRRGGACRPDRCRQSGSRAIAGDFREAPGAGHGSHARGRHDRLLRGTRPGAASGIPGARIGQPRFHVSHRAGQRVQPRLGVAAAAGGRGCRRAPRRAGAATGWCSTPPWTRRPSPRAPVSRMCVRSPFSSTTCPWP